MKSMTSLIICLLFFCGCHKEDPIVIINQPPIVRDTTIFDLKWKVNVAKPFREIVVSRYVQLYKNWYITTGDKGDPGLILYAFDISTGERAWEWHHSGLAKAYIRKMKNETQGQYPCIGHR